MEMDLNMETALAEKVMGMRDETMKLAVVDDASFSMATAAARSLKSLQKEIENYWEPLRVATKASYDAVLAKKKAMLQPLKEAEQNLKGRMGAYTLRKERERKLQERTMREEARKAAEARRADAAAAEAAGDLAAAEYARAEAEALEGVAEDGTIQSGVPKPEGVTQTKTWEVVAVDPQKVPVFFNQEELRPVDVRAVLRAIRASNGTAQIPGITYREKITVSVRR